jgi:hypothetical protein
MSAAIAGRASLALGEQVPQPLPLGGPGLAFRYVLILSYC